MAATDVIITGPDTSDRGASIAPSLLVSPGPGRFYAVELVTDAKLFEPGDSTPRTARNFFASWSKGLIKAPLDNAGETTYAVPQAAWEQLKASDKVFYRALTSAAEVEWVGIEVSYPNGVDASPPAIQLTGRTGLRTLKDRMRPEEASWRDGAGVGRSV